MAFSVNTNVAAIRALSNMRRYGNEQFTALTRLSSGLRINGPADDGAGLVSSEGLRAQIASARISSTTAAQGITFAQVVDDTHNSIGSLLQRLKDLAGQAASSSTTGSSRSAISAESNQLLQELGRIAATASFNGTTLFGSALGSTAYSFYIGDGAAVSTNNFVSVTVRAVNAGSVTGGISVNGSHFLSINVSSISGGVTWSASAIQEIDSAITALQAARANYTGAASRFQFAQSQLDSIITGISAADSAIRDADIAQETVNLSRAQILVQSGAAAIASAFALPQVALSLLTGR